MVLKCSLYVRVQDGDTLFLAALARAIEDGMTEEGAREALAPEQEIDIARCVQWLLDPGSMPGAEILDSTCE